MIKTSAVYSLAVLTCGYKTVFYFDINADSAKPRRWTAASSTFGA
jgi:hypothetical protein